MISKSRQDRRVFLNNVIVLLFTCSSNGIVCLYCNYKERSEKKRIRRERFIQSTWFVHPSATTEKRHHRRLVTCRMEGWLFSRRIIWPPPCRIHPLSETHFALDKYQNACLSTILRLEPFKPIIDIFFCHNIVLLSVFLKRSRYYLRKSKIGSWWARLKNYPSLALFRAYKTKNNVCVTCRIRFVPNLTVVSSRNHPIYLFGGVQ